VVSFSLYFRVGFPLFMLAVILPDLKYPWTYWVIS
jgi:hypothetical protein